MTIGNLNTMVIYRKAATSHEKQSDLVIFFSYEHLITIAKLDPRLLPKNKTSFSNRQADVWANRIQQRGPYPAR